MQLVQIQIDEKRVSRFGPWRSTVQRGGSGGGWLAFPRKGRVCGQDGADETLYKIPAGPGGWTVSVARLG